jgi:hypothetical protein
VSSSFFHPTAIAVGVLAVAMLVGTVVQFLFLRGLAKRHRAQWHHAGRPTIWSDQSLLSAWPTIRYIQRRAYRASGDPAGIAFCSRYRVPLLLSYWVTVFSFIAVVLLLFTAGWPNEWMK